jgi:hypothetical protein
MTTHTIALHILQATQCVRVCPCVSVCLCELCVRCWLSRCRGVEVPTRAFVHRWDVILRQSGTSSIELVVFAWPKLSLCPKCAILHTTRAYTRTSTLPLLALRHRQKAHVRGARVATHRHLARVERGRSRARCLLHLQLQLLGAATEARVEPDAVRQRCS